MEGVIDYSYNALSQGCADSSPFHVKTEPDPIEGFNEGFWGPCAESPLPESTLPGRDGVPSAPIENPGCVDPAATYGSSKDDAMHNCTISSTATKDSKKKHHTTTKGEAIYPCDICHKRYSQRQGVTRHQREAHEDNSLCPFCKSFEWNRRHQLTKHLKEKHADIDLNATLSNTTRNRREATKNKKHLLRQAFKHDPKGHGEPLSHSSIHTLSTVTKYSHVSLPATSPTSHVPHHHVDEPVTSCKREDSPDARGFDLYDPNPTTDTPFASLSTDEPPQPVDDVDMTVPHGQFWSSRAHMGGSTPDPSRNVMLPESISILYSPYFGGPVLEGNVFYL